MKGISCKEAVEFILKHEERKLSFRHRLLLWHHLTVCSLCRIFSGQNKLIVRMISGKKPHRLTLSEKEKAAIIQKVLDEPATP